MKRSLLSIVFIFLITILHGQEHPLSKVIDSVTDKLEHTTVENSMSFWNSSSLKFQTDSLYPYATTIVANLFLSAGAYPEAETIYNQAQKAILRMESDTPWWWENYSYINLQQSVLYLHLHDFIHARELAVNAKIGYENCMNRGMYYATALYVLSETALYNNQHVIARALAGEALIFSIITYANNPTKENYQDLSMIMKFQMTIEERLGYSKDAVNGYLELKKLNNQFGITDDLLDCTLGMAYVANEEYEKAIELLSNYIDVATTFDPDEYLLQSEEYIRIGLNILYSKYKLGYKDLYPLAKKLSKVQISTINERFSFLSTEERRDWWFTYEYSYLDLINKILLNSSESEANGLIANNSIISKGVLLRASTHITNEINKSKDKKIKDKYRNLQGLKENLIKVKDEKERKFLVSESNQLEKELLQEINVKVDDISDWKKVSKSLTSKEVALDFMRLDNLEDDNVKDYYAIIVNRNSEVPDIIHLFSELELSKILDDVQSSNSDHPIALMYSTDSRNSIRTRLYELIWSKIDRYLDGKKVIYYSPVGLLNSISFEALNDGERYLGDRYAMSLMSSIGNVPNFKNRKLHKISNAYVCGGIKYEANSDELLEAARSYSRSVYSIWEHRIGEMRSGWNYLPGTRAESTFIGNLMSEDGIDVELCQGISANEESFKNLDGKDVDLIHIATHGFYLSETKDLKNNSFYNPSMLDKHGRIDPLLQSGLIFAGANRVWKGEEALKGIDDGILTAKEISTLNLTGTKLVVLSACQTGQGIVAENEGVYGLQRAFKLAGAETLVMSLWEVDDFATNIMMSEFYRNYLAGESKADAFRKAVEFLRNYEGKDGNKPYSSPYYWGAFVMMD